MITVCCDKCGKIIPPLLEKYKSGTMYDKGIFITNIYRYNNSEEDSCSREIIDLCPECRKKLNEIVEKFFEEE